MSSDALPTPQIDGVVWSQVVANNTVFVGGDFRRARPAGSPAGVNTVTRSNLLAYDITTGVLNPSFAPAANAAVRVTAISPDRSRLYVGGNFTSINGVARYRIAAFDTATGALVANFAPVLNYTVNSIVATNETVYFGGGFSSVSGQTRQGAAAVSAVNGAVLPWAPALVGGKANGMVLSPDGSKIAIGGAFTSMNGSTRPGYGLGMVSSTGDGKVTLPFNANFTIKNAGANGSITSLYATADGIFGSGYDYGTGANFEGSFRASWSNGSILWLEDCHGDTYSVFAVNGLQYKAGHPHHCANIGGFPEVNPRVEHRASAYTIARTGTVARNTVGSSYTNFEGQPAPSQINWFPDINTGSYTGQNQGPWQVSGDERYVLYGGEFTRVNNKAQQGLARFAVPSIAPNKDGPQVTGSAFKPVLTASGADGIKLTFPSNWDRDNEFLTYQILRAGTASPVGEFTAASRFWKTPALTFTDTGLTPGQTYSYSVRAVDPFGNAVIGESTARAVPGGTPNTSPTANFSNTADGLSASFDGSASRDPDGSISSWSWNFGDGTSGTGPTTTRTYATSGTYSVTLTVTDNGGGTASTTRVVSVAGTVTPPAPGTLASDNFERTVTGGWGTATAGGAWALSGPTSGFSVGSGSGSVNLATGGANLLAKLPGVSTTASDLTVRTSLSQPVSGASAYVTAIGRAVGADDYRTRIVVNDAGKLNLQLQRGGTTLSAVTVGDLTYAAGEQLQLRLQVFGTSPTTIQAKVWRTGSNEPTAWTLSTTDSTAAMQSAGSVGLGFYIGGASTGLPRQATFDEFLVRSL